MSTVLFFAFTDGLATQKRMKERFAKAGFDVVSNSGTEYVFVNLSDAEHAMLKTIEGVLLVTHHVASSGPPRAAAFLRA